MELRDIRVWKEGEYQYPAAYGFVPFLRAYLHEDDQQRECVIVCPGGGYRIVSPTEGEIVAKAFYERGFQAFVFTYTCNLLDLAPLNQQPMQDLSRAVRCVRRNAAEFRVQPDKLAVCGFSAAGHLCGSLAAHYEDVEEPNPEYAAFPNRPDAVILAYPVITAGPFAHRDSFVALLGKGAAEEDLRYMSLETQVKETFPPCFMWQTATDDTVPVENSMLMAKALKDKGIPFAYHIFTDGRHALSVATREWEEGHHGPPYTMEQTDRVIKAVKSGEIPLSKRAKDNLLLTFDSEEKPPVSEEMKPKANPEAAVWTELAAQWLRKVF